MSQKITGTKEWSNRSLNIQVGCKNNCRYCYAQAMFCRFKRPGIWSEPRINQAALLRKFKKLDGVSMFPSTHDITPDNLDYVLTFLTGVLAPGNRVLIVSKPFLECIKRLCLDLKKYQDQILFRFTIGSADSNILKFWEPNAPSFEERIEALKYAHFSGYETSVSCEPMLDDKVSDVISAVTPYTTDAIWLGKANHLIARLKINGYRDNQTIEWASLLEATQTDEKINTLFELYRYNPLIKWKESIKNVVGLSLAEEAGLDI
jgi:uncharacterized Fe-S cluster-containing radical SAM superfamily protein